MWNWQIPWPTEVYSPQIPASPKIWSLYFFWCLNIYKPSRKFKSCFSLHNCQNLWLICPPTPVLQCLVAISCPSFIIIFEPWQAAYLATLPQFDPRKHYTEDRNDAGTQTTCLHRFSLKPFLILSQWLLYPCHFTSILFLKQGLYRVNNFQNRSRVSFSFYSVKLQYIAMTKHCRGIQAVKDDTGEKKQLDNSPSLEWGCWAEQINFARFRPKT